jgi:hypothetical protein
MGQVSRAETSVPIRATQYNSVHPFPLQRPPLQDDQRRPGVQQQWPAPADQVLHTASKPLPRSRLSARTEPKQNSNSHEPGHANPAIPHRTNIPPGRAAASKRLQLSPPPPSPLARRQLLRHRTLGRPHPNHIPDLRNAVIHHDLYVN